MDQTQAQRKAGRPRVNLEGDGHGNPTLRIRLPQETMALVKAAGGSAWARSVIESALAEHFVTIIPAERMHKSLFGLGREAYAGVDPVAHVRSVRDELESSLESRQSQDQK